VITEDKNRRSTGVDGWCAGCKASVAPAPHQCNELELVNGARPVKCKCNCSDEVKAILRSRLPLAKLCIIHNYTHYMHLCEQCLLDNKNTHHWWCSEMKESAHGDWTQATKERVKAVK